MHFTAAVAADGHFRAVVVTGQASLTGEDVAVFPSPLSAYHFIPSFYSMCALAVHSHW